MLIECFLFNQLNLVLDRETDIYRETDRIRKQIAVERRIQDDLRTEVVQLKSQLDESKQGLLAASRLTDQLENAKQQVNGLKEEGTSGFWVTIGGMGEALTQICVFPGMIFESNCILSRTLCFY